MNNANNGIDTTNIDANVNNGGSCVVTLSDLCPRNTVVNSSGDNIQVELTDLISAGFGLSRAPTSLEEHIF